MCLKAYKGPDGIEYVYDEHTQLLFKEGNGWPDLVGKLSSSEGVLTRRTACLGDILKRLSQCPESSVQEHFTAIDKCAPGCICDAVSGIVIP